MGPKWSTSLLVTTPSPSKPQVWGMAHMSDPKDVSAEATEGESIAIDDMRLWKVVAVVGSGYDTLLVVGLYSCVSRCSCGSVGIGPLKGYNLQFWYKSKMLHCGWILHFTIKALFNLNLAPHSFRFQQYTLKICTFAVEQAAALLLKGQLHLLLNGLLHLLLKGLLHLLHGLLHLLHVWWRLLLDVMYMLDGLVLICLLLSMLLLDLH